MLVHILLPASTLAIPAFFGLFGKKSAAPATPLISTTQASPRAIAPLTGSTHAIQETAPLPPSALSPVRIQGSPGIPLSRASTAGKGPNDALSVPRSPGANSIQDGSAVPPLTSQRSIIDPPVPAHVPMSLGKKILYAGLGATTIGAAGLIGFLAEKKVGDSKDDSTPSPGKKGVEPNTQVMDVDTTGWP